MSHRNAPLTPLGRRILCKRIEKGQPVSHVARQMGLSRATAHKWWRRYCAEGTAGLTDRSSRPLRSPKQTPQHQVRRIVQLRTKRKIGPFRIGATLGLPPSTVHRVLVREEMNVLSWLDRPTGVPIRRYEHKRPGDLIHIDVKKLGRIPSGGGHRIHGRGTHTRTHVGYDFLHVAIDDRSRLAYVEVLRDEKGATASGFLRRACEHYSTFGIRVKAVLTDNGSCYVSKDFQDTRTALGIKQRRTKPYHPQTNGKGERFNRTLADEWAYVRPYTTNSGRTRALAGFIHRYNFHRAHSALDGAPPISRVNNLFRHYT